MTWQHPNFVDRVLDGQMIANYRLAAELTAIDTTTDGRCVVIGTVDGCLSVLAIADPVVPGSAQFLASLPSRTRQAHIPPTIGSGPPDAIEREKKLKASNDSKEEQGSETRHVKLKTAATVAAAWAKASNDGSLQKVTSRACVIS